MFNRLRNVFGTPSNNTESLNEGSSNIDRCSLRKFQYGRPHFLQFTTDEEVQVSADHHIRPIIVPRDISAVPWNAGYAEAVNAGKSLWNEDQACIQAPALHYLEIREKCGEQDFFKSRLLCSNRERPCVSLPYYYFALFDGHAGTGAALAAANQLHHVIHEKLVDVLDHLLPSIEICVQTTSKDGVSMWFPEKEVPCVDLIVGALESAFHDMDELIKDDRHKYSIKGGCTVLVALFILGKLYIANAGDSRAVVSRQGQSIPMSQDFTPETERQRLCSVAAHCPHLLGGEFSHLEFIRRPLHKDLGKRILYKDSYMTGWAYKTVTSEDLKPNLVTGEGKRSRLLGTIGVTRGFGDHDLRALHSGVLIKPFLSSKPEVRVLDIECECLTDSDVLIMGTDGLWDVTSNEKAIEVVQRTLDQFLPDDDMKLKYRYASAAQDLVMSSRGKLVEKYWRTAEGKPATIDDISVFVIPLLPYKKEFLAWKEEYEIACSMYDSTNETNNMFGKLSLNSSPVALNKSSSGDNANTDNGVDSSLEASSEETKGNFDVAYLSTAVKLQTNALDNIDSAQVKENMVLNVPANYEWKTLAIVNRNTNKTDNNVNTDNKSHVTCTQITSQKMQNEGKLVEDVIIMKAMQSGENFCVSEDISNRNLRQHISHRNIKYIACYKNYKHQTYKYFSEARKKPSESNYTFENYESVIKNITSNIQAKYIRNCHMFHKFKRASHRSATRVSVSSTFSKRNSYSKSTSYKTLKKYKHSYANHLPVVPIVPVSNILSDCGGNFNQNDCRLYQAFKSKAPWIIASSDES